MSIRSLTTQLQQEKAEYKRVQQFQSARSIQEPQTEQTGSKQTPFMVGASSRKLVSERVPIEMPVQKQTASPQIGLKQREAETTYGVPGGIVARFGKDALNKPIEPKASEEVFTTELPSEPVPEQPLKEDSDESNEVETAQAQEQEQAAEEDDEAARITIELQSH